MALKVKCLDKRRTHNTRISNANDEIIFVIRKPTKNRTPNCFWFLKHKTL